MVLCFTQASTKDTQWNILFQSLVKMLTNKIQLHFATTSVEAS